MRRFADSATVPSAAALRAARADGVTGWAGYIGSPYDTHTWSPAEFHTVAVDIGGVLPVYVGPYDGPTLARANPLRDAEQCVSDLDAVARAGLPTHAACLDIERKGWDADPAEVLRYFAVFAHYLATHGGRAVLPYGAPATLIGLGQHDRISNVWAASWSDRPGRFHGWPPGIAPPGLSSAWHGHRAWQFAGNVSRYGMGVDLSVADDAILFAHPASSAPAVAHNPTTQTPSAPAPATPGIDLSLTIDGRTYSGRLLAKG